MRAMSELRLWVALSRVSPEQVIADGEALYWVGPTRDRKEVRGNGRCWEDLPGFLAWYEIGYCSEDCGRPRNGQRSVVTVRFGSFSVSGDHCHTWGRKSKGGECVETGQAGRRLML